MPFAYPSSIIIQRIQPKNGLSSWINENEKINPASITKYLPRKKRISSVTKKKKNLRGVHDAAAEKEERIGEKKGLQPCWSVAGLREKLLHVLAHLNDAPPGRVSLSFHTPRFEGLLRFYLTPGFLCAFFASRLSCQATALFSLVFLWQRRSALSFIPDTSAAPRTSRMLAAPPREGKISRAIVAVARGDGLVKFGTDGN